VARHRIRLTYCEQSFCQIDWVNFRRILGYWLWRALLVPEQDRIPPNLTERRPDDLQSRLAKRALLFGSAVSSSSINCPKAP